MEEKIKALNWLLTWASDKHGEQKWGEGEPYINHLIAVDAVVKSFYDYEPVVTNNIQLLRSAAVLHDVLEDTNVTRAEMEELFQKEVVDLVFAVTNAPGKNRKERHLLTYPKIRGYGSVAVALKLADRIANVRKCVQTKSKLFEMYVKEHVGFREALHRPDELPLMWLMLEVLFKLGNGQDWKTL